MPKQMTVLEYSSPKVRDGLIIGVKIVGCKSSHGYSYPVCVLRAAKTLYEGSPIFVFHPDARERRQGSRLLRDHFGNLENVRERQNGRGLYADLRVKQSHPLAADVLEQAATAQFGLSHNAVIDLDDDKQEVTKIISVNSVDLVNNPATTRNLFEEATMPVPDPDKKNDNPNADPNAAPENEGSFEDKMLAFMAQILTYIEPKDAAAVKSAEAAGAAVATESKDTPPVKRLTAIESVLDGDSDGQIGKSHKDFLAAARGVALDEIS